MAYYIYNVIQPPWVFLGSNALCSWSNRSVQFSSPFPFIVTLLANWMLNFSFPRHIYLDFQRIHVEKYLCSYLLNCASMLLFLIFKKDRTLHHEIIVCTVQSPLQIAGTLAEVGSGGC
jgi:hypothetical protein